MHGALAALMIAGCGADPVPCALVAPQLALVRTDYQSGLLAAVDATTGATCDALAVLGPDPAIRSTSEGVAVFDRTGGSALRLYAPGEYDRPLVELATEPGINLHDVAWVGDEWWLAPYERAQIVRLGADGTGRGAVDLSAHADADGLPEVDRFVATDAGLFVGLQRLDRDQGWAPQAGRVARLDPEGAAVDAWWEVGPNPKIYPDPSDPGRILALTGAFFVADGALVRLDPEAGVTTLLTEAALGYDLSGFAGVGSHGVVLGVDFVLGGPSRFDCVELETGVVTPGGSDPGWLVDAVAGDGRVFIAVRTGWAGTARDRVLAVDPETCAATTLTEGFALDPFGLVHIGG